MSDLYSFKGTEPQELPNRIRLSTGLTRHSPFTDDELKDAGYSGPYTKPEYDDQIETLVWSSDDMKWNVYTLPDEVFIGRIEEVIKNGFDLETFNNNNYFGPFSIPEEYDSSKQSLEWDFDLKKWVITNYPDSYFWEKIREKRNQKLTESDWTQLLDSPLSDSQKNIWSKYRQNLRDLPSTIKDPKEDITWPSIPQ